LSKHLIAVVIAAFALQGCQTRPAQTSVAAEDLDGIASTCTPTPAQITGSAAASATIAMTNDGWCAIRATESDGRPFLLALVRTRPEHGRVLIQPVNGKTRIEYTADPRYTGSDRFTIALRSRTPNTADATLQVAVTVSAGPNQAATPVSQPSAAPAAAPTRRSTPARRR
jgi:hypothetical protein